MGSTPHPAGDPSTAAPSRATACLAWSRCWSSANRPNPNAAIWQDTSSVYLKRNTPRTSTRNGIGGLASGWMALAHPSRRRSGTPTRRSRPVMSLTKAFVRLQHQSAALPDARRSILRVVWEIADLDAPDGRPYGQAFWALHLDSLACTQCLWREMLLGSSRFFHMRQITQLVEEVGAMNPRFVVSIFHRSQVLTDSVNCVKYILYN